MHTTLNLIKSTICLENIGTFVILLASPLDLIDLLSYNFNKIYKFYPCVFEH